MRPPKPRKRLRPRGLKRHWKWILILLVVLLLIPPIEVALVRFINPPRTRPMLLHQASTLFSRGPKAPLLYHWIDLPQIPEMFLKHLWISEDQRFFQHDGFDWKEMDLAMKEAERKGKPVRGASTITNQCARSIFLWQGRSWIRKGLESYYTIWMEAAAPEATHHGAVCERDRDGTRDLRGRSRLAALFRRQRARSDAGAVGHARGRAAESETLGSDQTGRRPYGGGSSAFSCGNRTQSFRRSSFTDWRFPETPYTFGK